MQIAAGCRRSSARTPPAVDALSRGSPSSPCSAQAPTISGRSRPVHPACEGLSARRFPGEVQTAHEGVHAILTGQPLGVAQYVDRSGVAAARKYDQALALEIHNDRLVIPDPGVRLPAAVRACVIEREALLKIGNALDLAGHQHRAIDQKARLALLSDLDPLAGEVLAARWWEVKLGTRREDDLAISPSLGVDNERHPPGTGAPDHAFQPAVVVAVPVRQHDGPQIG